MKKIVTVVFLFTVLLGLSGCGIAKVTEDEIKFKEEYEKLNGQKPDDSDEKHLNMEVAINNKMEYISSKEVVDIMKSKTGIIYFGFPECPWCRNVVPVLIDAAKSEGIDKIYYANLLKDRDIKELDGDKVIEKKKGSENYYKVLELLGDNSEIYDGLNDNNIKRLYFPTIVFVKNGEVKSVHVGTVDSQEDPSINLTSKEEKKLKSTLIEKISSIKSLACDTDKSC